MIFVLNPGGYTITGALYEQLSCPYKQNTHLACQRIPPDFATPTSDYVTLATGE